MRALILVLFPLTCVLIIAACHNRLEQKIDVSKDATKYLYLDTSDTLDDIRDNLHHCQTYLFKVQNQLFRLRCDSSTGDSSNGFYDALIEINRNGNWEKNTTISLGDEVSFVDMNGDGFPDFRSAYQSWSYPTFYDPSSHQFDSTEWTMPGDDDEIIDTAKNIHFNYKGVYHGCDQPISELYTYKGIIPYFFYELGFDRECLSEKISRIRLFQFEKGTDSLFHQVKTISTKDPTHFDYKSYWKKNYKQLLAEYK